MIKSVVLFKTNFAAFFPRVIVINLIIIFNKSMVILINYASVSLINGGLGGGGWFEWLGLGFGVRVFR